MTDDALTSKKEVIGSGPAVPMSAVQAALAEKDAEIEKLRALLDMARDCLPDGDYSIRIMAVKEIDAALAPVSSETP